MTLRLSITYVFTSLVPLYAQLAFWENHMFQHGDPFSGTRPLTGFMYTFQARNVLDCARSCSSLPECGSFFFTPSDKDCQMFSEALDYDVVKENLEAKSGAKYYVHNTVYTTSSYPPPIDFVCPINNGNWTPAQIPGGDIFYIRLFTDSFVVKSDAEAICASYNGTVLKIITLEKMKYFQNVVFQCPDAVTKSFWVDGSNEDAGPGWTSPAPSHRSYNFYNDNMWDISPLMHCVAGRRLVVLDVDDVQVCQTYMTWFLDTDAWKTSAGEPIPMTSSFWVSNRPNNADSHHCIRVWFEFNFLFDDVACSNSMKREVVICETDAL